MLNALKTSPPFDRHGVTTPRTTFDVSTPPNDAAVRSLTTRRRQQPKLASSGPGAIRFPLVLHPMCGSGSIDPVLLDPPPVHNECPQVNSACSCKSCPAHDSSSASTPSSPSVPSFSTMAALETSFFGSKSRTPTDCTLLGRPRSPPLCASSPQEWNRRRTSSPWRGSSVSRRCGSQRRTGLLRGRQSWRRIRRR
jgi:hypothetical protein